MQILANAFEIMGTVSIYSQVLFHKALCSKKHEDPPNKIELVDQLMRGKLKSPKRDGIKARELADSVLNWSGFC